MRATNRLAVDYLLKEGYDQIWLKPHTKFKDIVYCKSGNYRATDLWNLFDGICIGFGTVLYIQIKTNAWAKAEPIESFIEKSGIKVLVLNAKKKSNGRYEIAQREYPCPTNPI